jgi:hypothetical protein
VAKKQAIEHPSTCALGSLHVIVMNTNPLLAWNTIKPGSRKKAGGKSKPGKKKVQDEDDELDMSGA